MAVKKNNNGGCVRKGCCLFYVFIFLTLIPLAILSTYLVVSDDLDLFNEDPVGWFEGQVKEDESPTVEPIPPTIPPALEIESITPNVVKPTPTGPPPGLFN